MPYFLYEYPTEILISIFSKMNRTAFLRLSRSCKWIHNIIEENKRHITNCVTDHKISIAIQKPTLRRRYGMWNAPEPDVELPLFYKLTVCNGEDGDYLTYEMFCRKMVKYHELRVAELEICSKEMDDIIKLVEYLHTQQISCEKLAIFFPQNHEYLPEELTELLRPLKLVILPIESDYNDDVLCSYNHLADNVEHISLVEVQPDDVSRTLFHSNIMNKTSIYIHYIHNFRQEDDPFEYAGLYADFLNFYKSFMSTDEVKLKDFQFYFQNYRDDKYDPVLGSQEPNGLLMYITGNRHPQMQSRECPETYAVFHGSPTVFIEDPSNPNGPPLEAEFYPSGLPEKIRDRGNSYGDAYNRGNLKRSLLVKMWLLATDEFHLSRLVVSITEGETIGEYIMTLLADGSAKMRVYFAIVVLTGWESYKRFLGLMDTKNYEFPMEEIEEDVRKILCP